MDILNKVIFKVKNKKVRVKHIIFILLVIILLLMLCKCEKDATDKKKKKEEAIKDVCTVTNGNLNTLDVLLARTDLCSDKWFQDLSDYVDRLRDQNSILKDKESSKDKKIYALQQDIISVLEELENKQDIQTVDKLEKKVNEYKKYYDDNCKNGDK
ncbi:MULTISPECIES: hypothetical protein [unclassified Breznakia]|uniref:hypothetical protein n=1 Tax=unclassified Breznakia TaxID=2623764 RepID=UPI002474860F|nr:MULTISPECIES: hypothetical protein [unclassified Breznakia]MDH6368149.1 uncharacterized membrane protein YgaE (UPF0421/DUF939 family) [Breznakia sp. PH1-1]MDH6405238.1 uncharacterized membrane protein YgaE (UPF0421/DUF939 family) [Breznakia sp. PF1-11]MDH6412956.1 uncharacterized membrane protein YgaE (UPF0421/DUF939 family) [Breznakia sp. PFB1-11]MDH6415318.1 uncharacterized membrane protein YgaE (UPF0421/DUF939 family) [Breznakia sp. PFB1-14]MDH6416967.1 uncharacterized membrane protein Y